MVTLWMNCNNSVYRASKKELNDFSDGNIQRIHSLSYGKSEGMSGIECSGPAQPAGWKSRDGKLWFPTIKGRDGDRPRLPQAQRAPTAGTH